jgi:hypothetical protein
MTASQNLDESVVRGFGEEWSTFTQDRDGLTDEQRQSIFESYFAIPLPDDSLDFAFSLGVLHHVPNTQEAIRRSHGN